MQIGQRLNLVARPDRMPYLKKLFWVYFLLLIFEGALRKWIVPQLSAPLLVIRDPIGILIIAEAISTNKWPEKWSSVTGVLTVGLLGLCVLQMVAVGNPWIAALYGLRSYLLPFPVAFIMGENLDAEDLRKFGVFILWLLLPMTALEVAQYVSGASSFLNVGAYRGAEQISYVVGHARASGTFSYVVGPVSLNTIAAAFIFYGFVTEGFAKKWLLWAASFALLLSIPVIGARTLVYTLGAVVLCAVIAALSGVTQFGKTLRIAIPALIVSLLVSLLPVFSQASQSMRMRFRQAGNAEGTVGQVLEKRTIGVIINELESTDLSSNPIGIGMGQGAAAVTALLHGTPSFVAGEAEFDRAITELGLLPGMGFMLFRLFLTVMLAASAFARVREDTEPLAFLFVPSVVATLFFGVLEQPMETGFMVISVAFSLAALKQRAVMARSSPLVHRAQLPIRYSSSTRK
jgi:hypothetical protein